MKSRTSSVDAKSLSEASSGKHTQFINSKIRNKSQLKLTSEQNKNNSRLSSRSTINVSDKDLPLIKKLDSRSMIFSPSSLSLTPSASSINVCIKY